jgi:hypothetical protein
LIQGEPRSAFHRLRAGFWALLLAGAGQAFAQVPAETKEAGIPAAPPAPDPDSFSRLPLTVAQDALGTLEAPVAWGGPEWKTFAVDSLVVLGTALALDRPVERAFRRNRSGAMDRAAQRASDGGLLGALAASGTFYLYGRFGKDPEAAATGTDAIASLVILGGILDPAIKAAVGRDRPAMDHGPFFFKPFTGADASFISGHAALTFSVASVITAHYQEPWVACAAYGVAGLTCLARVAGNEHFTSDVVAGALLGWSVGRGVVGLNRVRRFGKRGTLSMAPDLRLDGTRGLQVRLVF